MTEKNIWKSYNFNDASEESAYDLLKGQKAALVEATQGVLSIEIDAVDGYLDANPPILAAIYRLYVVAPKLGNFRRKILSVAEFSNRGRFPVDIMNHLKNNERIERISKDEFLEKIQEIISSPTVRNSIENLYKQSLEVIEEL